MKSRKAEALNLNNAEKLQGGEREALACTRIESQKQRGKARPFLFYTDQSV
jgi:hypothetical protein